MPALNRIAATRIVTTPAALDAAPWPSTALALRFAADEVFIMPPTPEIKVPDPHAIVVSDNGFAGLWLSAAEARSFLERTCEWELPRQRPAFAQGMVAGIPAKLWLEADQVLILVPAPYTVDLEERLA